LILQVVTEKQELSVVISLKDGRVRR
jgi:hypothetical protein